MGINSRQTTVEMPGPIHPLEFQHPHPLIQAEIERKLFKTGLLYMVSAYGVLIIVSPDGKISSDKLPLRSSESWFLEYLVNYGK